MDKNVHVFFNTSLSSLFFSWSIISISSVHHFLQCQRSATRGIDLPPLCAIWIGNAHRMRHVRVGDRMCFLSSSTILPTPGADKHCGLHHSTCIPPHAPRTLRTDSNGRTPPQDQQAPSPTTVTNLAFPTSFPIGCRVAVTPSHPKHANTNGTVTRHTAKFVEFTPDNCPPNTIRILPKSLMVIPPCDHSLVIFGKILRSAT
jgi:hypothetical protein